MVSDFFKQVSLFFSGIFGLKELEKRRIDEVMEKFKDKKIYAQNSKSNFFGQESLGVAQIRGNGVLVLAEGVLYFKMLVPDRELSIPFTSITGVETPKFFLGKSKMMPLLKINFKNKDGKDDSAAWLLTNLAYWKDAIEKIAAQNNR